MSESSATKTLRTHLLTFGGHSQRFEDKLSPGIPDTNWGCHGVEVWLEGKFLKSLPARDNTIVRFGKKGEPRLAHQFNWLTARRKAGGLAFWWLRAPDGWYLFDDKLIWLREGVEKRVLVAQPKFKSAKALAYHINDLLLDHAARV